jgi:hypothetical protein
VRHAVGVAVTPVLALLAMVLTSCRLSRSDFRTIDAWLNCGECVNGERDSVKAMGAKAIPRLSVYLAGPSERKRALMRAKFSDSYALARVPGLDSAEYVETLLDNYVSMYQARAAQSLGDIGGWRKPLWFVPFTSRKRYVPLSVAEIWSWRAKRALDGALRDSSARHYRPDVIQAIRAAQETFYVVQFRGTVSPSHAAFGDTITIVASPSQRFSGNETASISHGLFPPAQVVISRSGDTLQIFAVADVGPHWIEVHNVGTEDETQLAPLLITSILDPNDRATASCKDADTSCWVSHAQPLVVTHARPFTSFLTLFFAPSEIDTVDVFRIRPVTNLRVTAQLDWYGAQNLDLSWRRCTPFVPTGNTLGATLAKPEITSEDIPALQCWILVSALRQPGAGSAVARLQVTAP